MSSRSDRPEQLSRTPHPPARRGPGSARSLRGAGTTRGRSPSPPGPAAASSRAPIQALPRTSSPTAQTSTVDAPLPPEHARAASRTAGEPDKAAPALAKGTAGLLSALLAAPAAQIAGTALRRFVRSVWLAVELIGVGLIFLLCFRSPVTVRGFFEPAGLGLALLSAVGTTGIVVSVVPARLYARLAPRKDFRSMVGGLILAAGIIQGCAAVALTMLVLLFQRIPALGPDGVPSAGASLAAGLVGLLANTVLVAAVTVALAPPLGTQAARLVFLAWLCLALYSYIATDFLGSVLTVVRLPLLPFAAGYSFGQSGVIGAAGVLALGVEAAYIGALIALAPRWVPLRKRLSF